MKKIIPLVSLIVAMLPGLASAAIVGLSNTGTGLSDNDIDPNYTIISDPTGLPTPLIPRDAIVTTSPGWPIPPWTIENATSAWIAPSENTEGPPGDYVYRTTFEVTAPATEVIIGLWSADNGGNDILLNGMSLGLTTSDPTFSFQTPFDSFSINSAFLNLGENTLDFVVNNLTVGPTGLRVELATSVIPLPATIWLFGSGLLGLLALRRNKTA